MTLFDDADHLSAAAPLAARMRPTRMDEVVGQIDAIAPGGPLRGLMDGSISVSTILWGPPGTGKTTLAYLVASNSDRTFAELSAVTAGVKEVRQVIEAAQRQLSMTGRQTVLFIDEVHRFSKSQQDALLPAVEQGWVLLIAATTENPSFSVIAPLLSRSMLVRLQPLSDQDVAQVLHRAIHDPRGLDGSVTISDEAVGHLVAIAGGDARKALTALEASAASGVTHISLELTERAAQHAAVRYDKDGDQHYDVVSAFIKSIRGSDPDAAIHYLIRMLLAGEDPRFVARRLMILASEDVGMADPTVLQTAVAAAQAVALVGMPEAQIILGHATIHAAIAPKSNAVVTALSAAQADLGAGIMGVVPAHLRDAHYSGAKTLGHGLTYVYPHDLPEGVAPQQYLPDVLVGRQYYRPTRHGAEAAWSEVTARLDRLRNPSQ